MGSHTSPTSLKLSRKHDHQLTITKDGYYTQSILIANTVSGAVAGNIILGGLIGWGIDAMSGGQYNLTPETVHVVLRPTSEEKKAVVSIDEIESQLTKLDQLLADEKISQEEYLEMRKKALTSQLG